LLADTDNLQEPDWENNHHELATQANKNRWFAAPVEFCACFGAKLHIKNPFSPFFGKVLMDDPGKSIHVLNR